MQKTCQAQNDCQILRDLSKERVDDGLLPLCDIMAPLMGQKVGRFVYKVYNVKRIRKLVNKLFGA